MKLARRLQPHDFNRILYITLNRPLNNSINSYSHFGLFNPVMLHSYLRAMRALQLSEFKILNFFLPIICTLFLHLLPVQNKNRLKLDGIFLLICVIILL